MSKVFSSRPAHLIALAWMRFFSAVQVLVGLYQCSNIYRVRSVRRGFAADVAVNSEMQALAPSALVD